MKQDLENIETPQVDDDILEQIEDAGGPQKSRLVTRVYRRSVNPSTGGKMFAFAGKFDYILDEQKVGEKFGPGEFQLNFKWRTKEGERKETTRTYYIGQEFADYTEKADEGAAGTVSGISNAPAAIPQANAAGNLLGNLLGNITAEKVTAGLALLEAVKKFLAPPPPPDYTKLFELMIANNRGQTVGDAVVIEALKQANKPAAPAPSVIDQINNLKAVKEAFAGDFAAGETSTRGSDKMDILIEMGLKYLPTLLEKHNNNYAAVGAEAAQNSFVKNLIKSDPDLTQYFFEVAAEKYGRDAAKQLASGFGVQIDFPGEQTPPAQLEQQQHQGAAPAQANT